MEAFTKFLQNEPVLNGKSLKKAVTLARNVINENAEASVNSISNLLFDSNSKYFPSALISQIAKFFEEKNLLDKFKSQADSLINASFWSSEKPNICSLINYSVISSVHFEGNEVFLFYFFIKFLFNLPSIIFDDLYTLISNFLDHINVNNFEIPEELQQLCDDAFDKRIPQTILATHFIKMADQNVSVYQLSKSFSIAVLCLQKKFSQEEIQKLRSLSSNLFAVSLKPEKFLLLQSYFILAIENSQLHNIFIQKVTEYLTRSTEQETFEIAYTALLNVIQITDLERFIPFFVRDFDTSYDETRIVLMNCFDKMFQFDSKKLTEQLTPLIVKLPWYSRLKKFSFPYLIQNGNEQLFESLIDAAQDIQMKPFVSKCVTSLLQNYDKSEVLNQNAILFQTIIEQSVSNIKLVLTKPLISFQSIFSVDQKFTDYCVSKTNSFLIKFDAAIVNPKKFSLLITKEDLENARKSFNWDLRIKCVAVFSAAGFPRNDEDAQLFIESIPSLLMIDSQDNQTKLIRLFDEFMHSFSTKKTYINFNKPLFVEKMNQKISPYLLPSCSSLVRQNALGILETIWKRFPEISPFDRRNLTSILKDGTVALKKSAYSVSKYLKEPLIDEKKVTINQLPFDPTSKSVKINTSSLQQFTILLEQDEIVLNLSEKDIINLIQFQFSSDNLEESQKENEWEVLSEIFHIICLLCLQLKATQETFEIATDHIFNSLIETRKSGLVMKCYPYLSQLIKKLKSSEKPKLYCERLIQVLADFDMAQMRRSAGLPFISVALIKGNSELFSDLTNALVNVCFKSENGNEVANALNTLNLIVKENNCPEKFFGVMFETIFKSCSRFPSEWDVLSAVDLSYNTLLHKIWTFYVKETTFRGFSRNAFLSKIDNSRNVIIESLKSEVPHCIYLSLLVFTLFPRDAGDLRFVPFILNHKSSKSSRIRRTAVRALLNVLPIGKEEEFMNKIEANGMNELHFLTIFKHEVAVIHNDQQNLYPYTINENLKKIYPLLYEPDFNNENDKLVSKCLLLKNWNEKTAPISIQNRLVEDLIINNNGNVNLTYLTEGLKFLVRTLSLDFIDNSHLHKICQLFKNTSELQIEIKSLYLQLIKFVKNASIDELLNDIVEISANPLLIALHHGLSFISDLIVNKSKIATLFLLLNDVPIVRQRVSLSFSNNGFFLNENEIIKLLISSMNNDEKLAILKLFIKNIQSKIDSDDFGEPIYFSVDEFFIIFECFENIKENFFKEFNDPLSLNEMRKLFIKIATPLCS